LFSPCAAFYRGSHESLRACAAFIFFTACTLTKSREAILSIEGSGSFIASAAAPIATGWSEPVPGWDFHPLWISAFSRRTEVMEYQNYQIEDSDSSDHEIRTDPS